MQERCPYCLAELRGPELVVRCATCLTALHAGCYREHGRCTTFGCAGEEVTRDRGAVQEPGWELHPLLPSAGGEARFVSLQQSERPGAGRRRPTFRLSLPERVLCGERLEGTLSISLPRALHGRGLRLRARALVDEEPLFSAEGVLIGQARRSWLEHLRLLVEPSEPLLLHGGRTELRFRLDPSPLEHRARVSAHDQLGPYHVLELQAELESRAYGWESRPHRVVVSHSPGRCKHRARRRSTGP